MPISASQLIRALLAALALSATLLIAPASAVVPDAVIDDFEDGDSSDWVFFGGNNAGGAGGVESDRPQEGAFYLSTGWGGQGTASGFYGGAFRNFDNGAQVELPVDPWFNVWVLNQSDATADAYTLEITLREDLDGNGWTNGAEDSFRLDRTFQSSQFNDEWVLLSAPLSAFSDQFTGGDGTFDGALDEIVIVIGGVQGTNPSAVEIDFDQFSFTSGGPLVAGALVFDDMEHGNPFGNGWFSFPGAVGAGGISPNAVDLPPQDGGNFSLESGWGGGTPGFFGGFGRTKPLDVGERDTFSFWINPNPGQDYTLEINLQDDDNGDAAINPPDDDEFQYNCVVSPGGPCAVSGGGWQRVSIPLADFFDDNSFLFGGNGVLDLQSPANGGNGELINIVVAVISNSGADVNFRTDFWAFSDGPLDEPVEVVDDFEDGLPSGVDVNGTPVGFYTFNDAASSVSLATTSAPPAPRPGAPVGNNVLSMNANIQAFAGFIHGFENATADTWVSQDWSAFVGLRLWVYGQNTGTGMFVDVLDNRNPGSSTDDAERYTVSFTDDFSGWRQLEFPFASFTRKEVGNGAPADGFTLTEVHGWALGGLNSGGPVTWYVDQVELYGEAEIPPLAVSFESAGYGFEEGTTGDVTVKLNRPMNDDDPAQVSVDYATAPGTATPGRDYLPTSGTLTFVNGGASELTLPVETIDNRKWEGGRSFFVALAGPVDVELGSVPSTTVFVEENDEFDPLLQDDFEDEPFLWEANESTTLTYLELGPGDPLGRPEQDTYEGVLQVDGPLRVEAVANNHFCKNPAGKKGGKQVVVNLLSTDSFDALTVDHTTVTLGGASERHTDKKTGLARRHEEDVDGDGDLDLVFHFLRSEVGDCDGGELPLAGLTYRGDAIAADTAGTAFERNFPIGHDWSGGDSLSFWYYGSGDGAEVHVKLKDNRAADPGPTGWSLAWSEEFNEPAGTQPDEQNWTFETGDGSAFGIPGWGNEELQYYTDDPDNAAMDGAGNLRITMREADGSLSCYYGPCEYTSARLVSQRKAEFAYGRIEARIQVPDGEDGLWPAFWSLGTDIALVQWPQTGEIDFMEYVSRLPNEIYGTIHGPGYSGGGSFGAPYDFGEAVANAYHTFVVEWQPDFITWFVDGIQYHTATPADVPGPWVFNDPVFLLLNMAIGGNFGGDVSPDLVLPQSMAVDYIRVYQAPDTAERFETSFVDDVAGWRKVNLPFADFQRSADQPVGAPDDGLGLSEVWGYGFELPGGGRALLDDVRLDIPPPPEALTVTSLGNDGEGSLRAALDRIASGGTISFDPALTGGVIVLSGPITPPVDVTIDASAAPGLTLDGGGADRLLVVNADTEVSVTGVTFTNGYGFQLAGGILNNGSLILDRAVVSGNVMATDVGDFWQGGGGIYNGENSSLLLRDSTVASNTSGWTGGGVYSFFNSTTIIERSTINDNVALDVGGGMRILGDAWITNSTLSANVSTAWHGGAAFITDGAVEVVHTTVTGNTSPSGTAGAFFVGTFGASPASLAIGNSIVGANGDFGCIAFFGGAGVVTLTSLGGNIGTDDFCFSAAQDTTFTDPLIGSLSDNGGPTQTHALEAGSPAIDTALAGNCPEADQRGIPRPQGAGCDAGAYERE